MATIYANIKGIKLTRESPEGGTGCVATMTFTLPAYTAATDNVQIGGGGYYRGTALTSETIATLIAATRRDGKTVTIGNPAATNPSVAICAESGKHGATEYWLGTFTISASNILCNVCNTTGTEVDALSGVTDREFTIMLSYRVA